MKKIFFTVLAFFSASLFAQSITTASAYFKTISEYYATIKDYEVDFEIKVEKQESAGKLSFKAPDLLRLDYTNPQEQESAIMVMSLQFICQIQMLFFSRILQMTLVPNLLQLRRACLV